MLQVRLLGGAGIVSDGKVVNGGATQRHRLALLALLTCAPQRQLSRDKLMALLWPDADVDSAQNLLRVALHALRRALGTDAFASDGPVIRLETKTVSVDVIEFEKAVENGRLEEAVAHYHGEFLDGFHLSDAPEFDQWMEVQRSVLRQKCSSALRELAEGSSRNGAHREAADWWRRAAALSPFDSQVAISLMRALGSSGDVAGAVLHARTHAGLLRNELGVQPPVAIVQLESELRDGTFVPVLPNASAVELGSFAHGSDSARSGASADLDLRSAIAPAGNIPLRHSWRLLPRWSIVAGLALVAISVPAGARLQRLLKHSSALVSNRIIVVPFENETGDSSLSMVGRMAADWITQSLDRTGLAEVVPASEVAMAGTRLSRRTTPATPAPVRDLALDMRAGQLVSGRYYRHASGVAFQAMIVDTETGTITRTIEVRDDAPRPIEEIVDRLRQRIVGALATVLDPRMADWSKSASQPPTFEAYQLYARALDMRAGGGDFDQQREVARLLLRAATVDSSFTVPLIWAVRVYMDIGEFAKADSVAQMLALIRDRLAPWDRAMYDYYAANLRGEHPAAYQAMRRVVSLAPGSPWVLQYAFAAMTIGRGREAIGILNSDDGRRNITSPRYWNLLLNARHLLGDYTGELADVARMRVYLPQGGRDAELAAWSALGRVEPVVAAAESLLVSTPISFQSIFRVSSIATELRVHGHFDESRRLFGLVVDRMNRGTNEARADRSFRMAFSIASVRAGREDDARPLLEALAKEPDVGWEVIGHLGILAARAGNQAQAEERLQWLLRREGEFDYGEPTMWAAAVAAHLGQLERAIEIYQVALTRGYYQHVRPVHSNPILEPLRAYAPFREISRLR